MNIPEGYQTVMVYLIVDGAAKFIDFTTHVFNAVEKKEVRSMRDENTIQHSEIRIGDSTIMFADSTEEAKPRTAGFFIYVENADETYKKAIARGATAVSGLSDKSYGRSGGVKDPFGNIWWITSVQ